MSDFNKNNQQQGNTPGFTPGANPPNKSNNPFKQRAEQNNTTNNQVSNNTSQKNPFKVNRVPSSEVGQGNQGNIQEIGKNDVTVQQQLNNIPPNNSNQNTQIKQDGKPTNPFYNNNIAFNNQNQPNNNAQTQNRNKPSGNPKDIIHINPFQMENQVNTSSNPFLNNLPIQTSNAPSSTPLTSPVPMFPQKSGDNSSNVAQTPPKNIVPIVIKPADSKPITGTGANSIFTSPNVFMNNNIQTAGTNIFNQTNNPLTQSVNPFMNNNIKPVDTNPTNNNLLSFAKPSDISTNAPSSILKNNNVKIQDTTKLEPETKIQNQTKVQNPAGNIFSNPTITVKTEETTKQDNMFSPIPKPITSIPPKPGGVSQIFSNTPSTANVTITSASVSLSSVPSSPNSPNYSNLYQEASKSNSSPKQPPTPPMAESCDYFQPMPPEVFKLYLDSESMKSLACNDPQTMKKHIETNQPILMKLFMNLQHYYQSPKRTQFYNQKYKTTENLGFPKKVYLNLFVGKTEEASWFYDLLKILISDIATKLDTDELIAHYFIGKALQKTKFYEKFLRTTETGTHNISYDALKTLLNQDETQINYKNKHLKELIQEVNLLYYEDRIYLLETVIHILNDKNKDYRGMRNTAISLNIEQFLWNTYKSLANKQLISDFPFPDSDYWKNEFESQIVQEQYKILRLIVSLTNRYLESAKYPRMMNLKDVLKVFDEQKFVGSTNKYRKYALALKIQENQINILLNLLPLFEMINYEKGAHEILKNKNFTKEMYESIMKATSEQAYILKNLLPSVKQIYQLNDVADYKQRSLGLVQKYVQNSFRWMIWLEVYLQNPVKETSYRDKFRIYCIILNQTVTQLWDYGTYPNIKKEIIALMRSENVSRVEKSSSSQSQHLNNQSTIMDDIFEIMTKLLGVRGQDSVQPVLTFMSQHLGKDFLYQNICKPLMGCIQDRRKLYSVQNPNSQYYFGMNSKSLAIIVEFLTKCIIIHSKELQWVQDWLFFTSLTNHSQYQSKHQGSGGIKLVVFLFDCIIFFKNKKAHKILKLLFDALTEIVLSKTDIKLISVATSICYHQYRADGSLYNMIQKLWNPQNPQEVELRTSILLHLKAILKIPFVENYFVFPSKRSTDISKTYQELVTRRQIAHRYEKPGQPSEILNDLCNMQSAQSLWVPDILNILKASNDYLSLEIYAMMLEKMCIPNQNYSTNQYNLFSQFIEVLNESNLESTVLQVLDIIDLNNALQSSNIKNNIESFHNKVLYQYKKNTDVQNDQEFKQINCRIYFALKVIEHSLELLQMLAVKDPKQALTNGMIQKLKIVQYVNEWLGKKMSIYHYQKSYAYNLRERSERYNLVMVIAAHFKINYDLHTVEDLPFDTLDLQRKQDTSMFFKYWKECNIQLFFNVQKRSDRFSNSKVQTISIRVLRVLTKCLLFWGKVQSQCKPSLYSLLAQPNTEVTRALNYRQEIHYLFKLMINKLIEFSPKRDSSEVCEVFNFFICLLNIQPAMIGCLFQELHSLSSLNKLLQKGINTLFYWNRYQKQQVYAAHKILIFLKDLIKSPSYRAEGLRLINGQIYIPAQVIKTLPRNTLQNQIQTLCSPQVYQNEIYNVINQQKIYFHLVRYSIIQSVTEITLQSILNNQSTFQGNYDNVFEFLYLSGLSKQILDCKETSSQILTLISNYFVKLEFPYQSYQWDSIKFVDANQYGYGRNYQIIPMKKQLANLSIKQSEDVYAKFHKYNIVKSLEIVKKATLNRWSQLFIVLGSTGKHGYSISHSNKSSNLGKMKDDFGNAFSLLNTRMFKIQKGFEDIISSKIDLLANMIPSIIDKTSISQITDFQPMTQSKLSMLEMIFKWIYKLNPKAKYVSKLAEQSFEYLNNIFNNSQSSKRSLIASSLLNTLGLVYRINKINTQHITKAAILLYLEPDCLTRNVMISSFVPELNKHVGTKYFNELCGKMIALQLIQNPDPIDYLIITKALFEFQKVDEDILLNFQYFSQLPSSINLNVNMDMNIQLWRFQIVAHFLVKQHNLFQLKEILCYLQNIKLTFRSILANTTQINFIYLPKHLEEKNSHKTLHIEYLLLYLAELKILKLLIQNRTVLQHQPANIGQFVFDFFQNKLISQIHQYQHIEGEPLLKEVPKSRQNFKQYSSQYKKNILQFMFEVVSLDTILLYVQILKAAVNLNLWKAEHHIQSILRSLQNQLFNRLDTNLRYKQSVKESFEYYHTYLNSVQTSIKMFYINTLLPKYTYDQYIDKHKEVLQCIYDTGFALIQKKQNCYEIYKPDFQKQLENFKSWTMKGAKRMKDFFKKDGEKY